MTMSLLTIIAASLLWAMNVKVKRASEHFGDRNQVGGYPDIR